MCLSSAEVNVVWTQETVVRIGVMAIGTDLVRIHHVVGGQLAESIIVRAHVWDVVC